MIVIFNTVDYDYVIEVAKDRIRGKNYRVVVVVPGRRIP